MLQIDQQYFQSDSNEDNQDENVKTTRFSQLDDEQAAKLYEERFRQIQSDMMKKIQMKKSNQKKIQNNPRSSSSLGTFGTPQQTFLQGQSQLQVNQNGQLSTKNSSQRAQIMSKLQGASQSIGFMNQSTTLNGGSRLPTEDNGQEIMHNFIPQKHKLKTQRSCEFIVYNSNQSPSHTRSVDENDIIFLNQGFQPNNGNSQKSHNIKQNTKQEQKQQGVINQKPNKINQTTVPSSASQRPYLSPPNKRTTQHQSQQQKQQTSNSTQQFISRQELSPKSRTPNMSTGFFSPQAHQTSYKQNNGAQSTTNRRNQIENDQKRIQDRKKIDGSSTGVMLKANQHLNGSQTATAALYNNTNNMSNMQFSTYANANTSTNSYLQQSQIAKVSTGVQGSNNSSNNVNGSYQVQNKLNSNIVNNANQKKKDSISINNNKRNEIEELDLRIQTIEKEIERDNELVANQNKKQNTSQIQSATTKNFYKSNQPKQYGNSPSHHISTDIGLISTGQSIGNSNRHSTYEKASTTTHKQTIAQQMLNFYSPKQVYLSTDSAQLRKLQMQIDDKSDTAPISTKNGQKNNSKNQYEFSKLQIPQSENQAFSIENSSYNNTPRSVNPIHDFRPFSKQSKKQVNFKSDHANTETQEERQGKFIQKSPVYSKNPSHPQTVTSPLNISVPSGDITPSLLNLKSQIQNQQQQVVSSSNRRNQQNFSNPPSMTRFSNNTPAQYSINQSSTNSLKFQKKNNTGSQQQYSQNSYSNLQYQNSQEDEDDPEMNEFEYLEKIVCAKNTETSSIADDESTQNGNTNNYQGYAKNQKIQTDPKNQSNQNSQANSRQKKHSSTAIQQQKPREIEKKITPLKGQFATRNQPQSNRESTNIQQIPPQSASVNSSPMQYSMIAPLQNKATGTSYLSLRQSDIIHPNSYSDSPQVNPFQPTNLQLKTLENNFALNPKENTNQYRKFSNNYYNNSSQTAPQSQQNTSVQIYNIYNQSNQVPSSVSTQKSSNQALDKKINKKMNRSSEVISKNSNSSNNPSSQGNNFTRTPSVVSSSNISTISQGINTQTQGQNQSQSLNKGNQLQMSNKQKNSNGLMVTHTLDTFKNKNDIKIKNSEQISRTINQDPIHSSLIRTDLPKKSNLKQARFEDDTEEYQLEQMSKNLHKKLNLLLETANQCNENMKSYRINQNN